VGEGHYTQIELSISEQVATITLSRPHVRNAFDENLLAELTDAARRLTTELPARVVILAGKGKSFCAGADLDWMRRMSKYDFAQNLEDANGLAGCLKALDELPQPLVGRIQGPVIGGGMDLLAVCDVATATDEAVFGFSEVKLGLSPACISPYVVRKIGQGPCNELFLTGRRFHAEEAMHLGLINHLVQPVDLDGQIDKIVTGLLGSGPQAMASCKKMLRKIPLMPLDQAGKYTAEIIARLRAGDEGKEGIRAFLERRHPGWAICGRDEGVDGK